MHLISLCVPFYSHLKSQKSLIEAFLDAGHTVTIVTHFKLNNLVKQLGADLYSVNRMDSFLDDPAIEAANGIAYTAAMMHEIAMRIDEMTDEMRTLNPNGIIFDSATRRGKMIGLKIGVPTVARSAMYPPLYQYNRTNTIQKVLLRDIFRAPGAFFTIGKAITQLIFRQKPQDYDELYTRLYNDNDIVTCTAIPHCLFEENHSVKNLQVYQHHGLNFQEHTEDQPEWLWLKQEKRPIIYMSLGSLISVGDEILQTLERVSGGKVLFVVSTGPHGGSGRSENVVWESFVPQKQILDSSMVCITHGGINTVIECMARKIPMLCTPYLADQRLYSHRVEQLRIGIVEKKSVLKNQKKLEKVLSAIIGRNYRYQEAYLALDVYDAMKPYQSLIEWFESQTSSLGDK